MSLCKINQVLAPEKHDQVISPSSQLIEQKMGVRDKIRSWNFKSKVEHTCEVENGKVCEWEGKQNGAMISCPYNLY